MDHQVRQIVEINIKNSPRHFLKYLWDNALILLCNLQTFIVIFQRFDLQGDFSYNS